ncbi:hypothetical protein GALMADRAFT_229236 [Galerina marginata CBS 339.88]|uniref:Uncharacterized protein n=1 Tax=Galerina marginata (strain CBS 339.88) TaxID=685588 RepID=A0A067SQ11_GALM3|nr:hypothetical protein GALMADRAFT_229236 [Galerina marginata CBS 339.88]
MIAFLADPGHSNAAAAHTPLLEPTALSSIKPEVFRRLPNHQRTTPSQTTSHRSPLSDNLLPTRCGEIPTSRSPAAPSLLP